MTKAVWIVWNEGMTHGVVLTDEGQAHDLRNGVYTEGDLTEAMVELHGGETLTIDAVQLEVKL